MPKHGQEVTRHPVAPTMRRAFLKALDMKGLKQGKTLPEIMYDLIEAEGMLAVMDRIAKFQERTGEMNVKHSGEVTSLVQVLTGIASGAGYDSAVESESSGLRH